MGFFGVCFCFAVAACLVPYRVFALAFVAAGLAAPFLTEAPFGRCVCAIGAFAALLRAIDLLRMRERWPLWRRVLHAMSPVDTRRLLRTRPPIRFPFAFAFLWIGVAGAGGAGVMMASRLPAPLVGRFIAGAVFALASSELLFLILALVYAVLGFEAPELHRMPILSRSVQEFWGVRWNRTVGVWLRSNCFAPLARRGYPKLGLLWAFAFSGLGHAYIAFAGILRPWSACVMLAFFVAQAVFILVETTIGVRAWRPLVGHAWALVTIGGTSPLFLEPLLRLLF